MPNRTKNQTFQILDLYNQGLTNLTICKNLNCSLRTVISVLNRRGLRSHKWEPVDESKIKHLLIGSYLGDGYFTKKLINNESRLCLAHKNDQREYFLWKYEKLKSIGLSNSFQERDYITEKGKKHIKLITRSKAHPVFSNFRIEGYDNLIGKRNFKLIEELNKESFSIWYLDDGSVTSDGLSICCESIPYREKELLKSLIYKNLQIELNVTSGTLYIPQKELSKVQNIIEPFCPNSMKYKLIPYHNR